MFGISPEYLKGDHGFSKVICSLLRTLIVPIKMDFEKAAFWVLMFNLPLLCMSETMGAQIGKSVGVVEEVETDEDEIGWEEYLCVKIRMDLSKPLVGGRVLKLQGESTWKAFQYERLTKFCFHCGVIRHGVASCMGLTRNARQGPSSSIQFGTWLHASPVFKRSNSGRGWFEGAANVKSPELSHMEAARSLRSVGSRHGDYCQEEGGVYGKNKSHTVMEYHSGEGGGARDVLITMGGPNSVHVSNLIAHYNADISGAK
jgi:hypothetical protein